MSYNNLMYNKIITMSTIKKFINYGGIAYIYAGCCLEQLDDSAQAFKAYKQAKYFEIQLCIYIA